MKVLIKSAKIVNTLSPFHLKTKDILIDNGLIVKIADEIKAVNETIIEGENLMVSAGWFDLYSVVREPGNEHKDSLKNLANSAAFGGFTQVLGVSGANPPLHHRSQIEFVKNNSKLFPVKINPLGTITENKAGENITELFDMHQADVLAFSDGKNSIRNPELLKRALLYVKPFGGTIMVYSEDEQLSKGGMINEGKVAATLGMKVRPALAEEIQLERNLSIAQYTDSKIHIHAISTAQSVEIIKKAKTKGVKVTCDVHVANLYYTDENTSDFDTNFKVLPVLRTSNDVDALIQGLKDGVIDAISSGHTPHDEESKECEFDHAEFGLCSLEITAAAAFKKLEKCFSPEELALLLSENPRKIVGVNNPLIQEGEKAEICIFNKSDWEFKKAQLQSMAKNNPFIGEKFNLKVIGIYHNHQLNLNAK